MTAQTHAIPTKTEEKLRAPWESWEELAGPRIGEQPCLPGSPSPAACQNPPGRVLFSARRSGSHTVMTMRQQWRIVGATGDPSFNPVYSLACLEQVLKISGLPRSPGGVVHGKGPRPSHCAGAAVTGLPAGGPRPPTGITWLGPVCLPNTSPHACGSGAVGVLQLRGGRKPDGIFSFLDEVTVTTWVIRPVWGFLLSRPLGGGWS